MKVSTKSRYAIKLMLDIAENEYKGNVSVRDVSERTGIPLKYLEQIVNTLCKTGFVKSKRGSQGGYILSRNTESYTMGDIIRTMEGDISDDYIDDGETINDFWHHLYNLLNEYMDSVTLGDILEKEKKKNEVYEYYI
jgi:Rrf2 family protein